MAAASSASSTSCVDDNTCSNDVVLTGLSEKLTQINVSGDERVIIPQHLRVPESLMNVLTFGSFAAETLSHQPLENAKLDEKSTRRLYLFLTWPFPYLIIFSDALSDLNQLLIINTIFP